MSIYPYCKDTVDVTQTQKKDLQTMLRPNFSEIEKYFIQSNARRGQSRMQQCLIKTR